MMCTRRWIIENMQRAKFGSCCGDNEGVFSVMSLEDSSVEDPPAEGKTVSLILLVVSSFSS
ncbi:hypothetical protein LINGRAHAP2_LOCUS6747 [Linum grandiflorum]